MSSFHWFLFFSAVLISHVFVCPPFINFQPASNSPLIRRRAPLLPYQAAKFLFSVSPLFLPLLTSTLMKSSSLCGFIVPLEYSKPASETHKAADCVFCGGFSWILLFRQISQSQASLCKIKIKKAPHEQPEACRVLKTKHCNPWLQLLVLAAFC